MLASQPRSTDESLTYDCNKGCKEQLTTFSYAGAASTLRAQVCKEVGWKWQAVPSTGLPTIAEHKCRGNTWSACTTLLERLAHRAPVRHHNLNISVSVVGLVVFLRVPLRAASMRATRDMSGRCTLPTVGVMDALSCIVDATVSARGTLCSRAGYRRCLLRSSLLRSRAGCCGCMSCSPLLGLRAA